MPPHPLERQDEHHNGNIDASPLLGVDTQSIRSVDSWEKALARCLAPAEVTAMAHEPFYLRLRARDLDIVRLLHLDVQPHRLRVRSTNGCRFYQFVVPVQGTLEAGHEARRAVVGPGSFVVLDPTSTYDLVFDEAATALIIQAPQRVVGISPTLVGHITATGIGADGDLIGGIMSLLVRLADDVLVSSPHHPVRLAYNLVDLLTTVLLEQLSTAAPGGSVQELMLQITAFINDHLGDSDLSADTVASMHYISPRYLRKLFGTQNMKVSEWIRTRRLEVCRRQLIDPVMADEPISAIAARWGFPDPAHFSRLFKATYDLNPRQFRRERLRGTHPEDADEG